MASESRRPAECLCGAGCAGECEEGLVEHLLKRGIDWSVAYEREARRAAALEVALAKEKWARRVLEEEIAVLLGRRAA
jgi:hypothetical protein